MTVGSEVLVDAIGCDAEALRSLSVAKALLEAVRHRLELRVVGAPLWHQFGGEGGVTGVYLLTESHLCIHTYPEHRTATLNLYCCRPRPAFPWDEELAKAFGATRVDIRIVDRAIP